MSLLVETIKLEDGILRNLSYHNERMKKSLWGVFGIYDEPDLESRINIPGNAVSGIYKCRVEYDKKIKKIEFLPYVIKPVRSLCIIEDDKINYRYKFVSRTDILKLMEKRGECDDILIIKNGMVTDASYANVIFRDYEGNWVTPSTYLLPGTRRAGLLQQGLITEANISYKDLDKFNEVKLINAMIDPDDVEGIPLANLVRK